MQEFIKELIKKKKSRFKDDYSEMVADYNRELKTARDYNGRQILELLQNCDDQEASEVFIELDKKAQRISISNNGIPFSADGYQSLFISNLSSKTSLRKYIGNKGLGFRSILNWSTTIEIISNGVAVKYSEEGRQNAWLELFPESTRKEIITKRNLDEDVIPIPFLAVPSESKIFTTGLYVTTINLYYREEFLDRILEQLNEITPETILFLKHINSVKFNGVDDGEDIWCSKTSTLNHLENFSYSQVIKTREHEWLIFEKEELLPKRYSDTDKKDDEYYQIKIAVEKNFKVSSPNLYSFFPTNILLKQPYILHATFDLDSSRNQIIETNKNQYLINEVATFTLAVAEYFKTQGVNYIPLQIINHNHKADSLSKANYDYYKPFDTYLNFKHLYPTVNGEYKNLSSVVYNSDEFARMLINCNAQEVFAEHLIPLGELSNEEVGLLKLNLKKVSTILLYYDRISKIGKLDLLVTQRLNLIEVVTDEFYWDIKHKGLNCLSILTNADNSVIEGKDYIYTPPSNEVKLKTPSYTDIHFVNEVLFNGLLELFKFQDQSTIADKGRFIYEKLNGYCNIHSYEPATLVQKIISETNALRFHLNADAIIKEMNACLFYNYLLLPDSTRNSELAINDIPCISANGKIKNSNDLTFSEEYPSGKLAKVIFGDALCEANLIAKPGDLGIDHRDLHEVDRFLKWIKVNEFLKIHQITSDTNDIWYVRWIADHNNIQSRKHELQLLTIADFTSLVAQMSISQLICWLHFDQKLNKQFNDRINEDMVIINDGFIAQKPSYLKYLLSNHTNFNIQDHLLDEKLSWVNKDQINFNDKLFLDNNISKSDVLQTLILLGAKSDFNELSITRVEKIIDEIFDHYPDGRNSQTIYKKALQHYLVNKQILKNGVYLFANDGERLVRLFSNNIYFSDKIKLPQKLKKHYPIFNFPSRAGGLEAISFFRIKDLKNVDIAIKEKVIQIEQTNVFNQLFEDLKPYILTIRFSQVDNEVARRSLVTLINKIDIQFCSTIIFEINDEKIEVDEHEFLFSDDKYYIKINEYDTIVSLKKSIKFLDSIAEILSNTFDVSSEKTEFKNLFRNRYDDILFSFENEYGIDLINEAKNLLGLSDNKFTFWQAIFQSKGVDYTEKIDDHLLEKRIEDIFGKHYESQNIDYDNLNTEIQLNNVIDLFRLLKINPKAFNNQFNDKLSFEIKHLKILNNAYDVLREKIKSSLWFQCDNNSSEERAKFLQYLSEFDHNKHLLEEKAKEYSATYEIEVEKILFEIIFSLFPQLEMKNPIDLDLKKSENESSFSAEEIYKIADDPKLRSLIYFDKEAEIIREILSRNDGFINTPDIELAEKNIKEVDSKFLKPGSENASIYKKGIFVARDSDLRKRKIKGKTCEKIVFDYIRNVLKLKVELLSEENEGLHHDLRYFDENNIRKYIEVKSFDYGKFFLSRHEYEFGLKNKEDYEIWLVRNYEEVFIIRDFFNNPKYQPLPNEYLVLLDQL